MFVGSPSADLDYFTDAQLVIQVENLANLGPTADFPGTCMLLI